MFFTIDQIERACGLLLLTEFNTFLYCCKKCQCEFVSGSNLEVHILSEHQDDEKPIESIFVNDDIHLFGLAPIQYEPTNVIIEQIESTVEQLDETNCEEAIEVDESKPLTLLLVNENVGNDNINKIATTRTEDEMLVGENLEGNQDLKEKANLIDDIGHSSLVTANKESTSSKSKNRKSNRNEEWIPIQSDGHPTESKTSNQVPISKFYCEMCPSLSFKYKQSMLRHMTTLHILKDRKRCKICNKYPKMGLEYHMKRFHSDHRFKCDLCDATFTQSGSRVIHMRIHTGEKPFICATCGRAFSSYSGCYIHETQVHDSVKRHKCQHCDRTFKQRNLLLDHINAIHLKQRPHACDICGKCFVSKKSMKVHKSIHGETNLKCRYCEKMFKVGSSRRRHEKVYHEKVIMIGDEIMNIYSKRDRIKMEMHGIDVKK